VLRLRLLDTCLEVLLILPGTGISLVGFELLGALMVTDQERGSRSEESALQSWKKCPIRGIGSQHAYGPTSSLELPK